MKAYCHRCKLIRIHVGGYCLACGLYNGEYAMAVTCTHIGHRYCHTFRGWICTRCVPRRDPLKNGKPV